MNKKTQFNLGWGESVIVRQALAKTLPLEYLNSMYSVDKNAIENMGYTNHSGDPDLINMTRNVIYRQIGISYPHVLITNGATGANIIALKTFREMEYKTVTTRKGPYFPFYPKTIEKAGLRHLEEPKVEMDTIVLLDSPSNPLSLTGGLKQSNSSLLPTIWDAVYHNEIYQTVMPLAPFHTVMTGSYSKLLGINGIRLGWIATKEEQLYNAMKERITYEYCGLSKPSEDITKMILSNLDWSQFTTTARSYLDDNRETWSKLEKYFDKPVSLNGMFYYDYIDLKCWKLLEKSEIEWMPGNACGHLSSYGRFNLAQDRTLLSQAVRTILKNDKSKRTR